MFSYTAFFTVHVAIYAHCPIGAWAVFHLEFFCWGGSSEESLVPCPSFFLRARAGRNASHGTFLHQKRGTGNESTPKLGVSPHCQLCFHTLNHISGMQILGGEAPVVWREGGGGS